MSRRKPPDQDSHWSFCPACAEVVACRRSEDLGGPCPASYTESCTLVAAFPDQEIVRAAYRIGGRAAVIGLLLDHQDPAVVAQARRRSEAESMFDSVNNQVSLSMQEMTSKLQKGMMRALGKPMPDALQLAQAEIKDLLDSGDITEATTTYDQDAGIRVTVKARAKPEVIDSLVELGFDLGDLDD